MILVFSFVMSLFDVDIARAEVFEDNREIGEVSGMKLVYNLDDNGDILVEVPSLSYSCTIPSKGKNYIVYRYPTHPELCILIFDDYKWGEVNVDNNNIISIDLLGSSVIYNFRNVNGKIEQGKYNNLEHWGVPLIYGTQVPLVLNNSIDIKDGSSNFFLQRPLVRPTELSLMMGKVETAPIAKTIIGMMALLIPLVVSFLGLRKALKMLLGVLGKA